MTFTLSSVFIGMSFNAKAAGNAGATETTEFDILYDTGFKTEFGTTVNGSPGSALNNGNGIGGYWFYEQRNSNYSISSDSLTEVGTSKQYNSGEEKKLHIDPAGESVYMYADTTYDYSSVRQNGQAIVSNAIRQPVKNIIPVCKTNNLTFTLCFYISQSENLNGNAFNESLHTVQYQVVFKVENTNRNSKGKGDYFIFVLPLYDARYNQAPAYDNGLRDTAGKKYIKNISTGEFLSASVTAGNLYTVNYAVAQKIQSVFNEAKGKNYLSDSNWSDMSISDFSIEQSVPGTYRTGCYFSNISLRYDSDVENAYLDDVYNCGFNVYSTTEGDGTIAGRLSNTDDSAPSWTIAQWNSKYNILDGYKIDNSDLTLWGDASKQVFIRKSSNVLGLLLNASAEYSSDRVSNQPWPCLLLNQEFDFDNHIKVDALDALYMNVTFDITKMENKMHGAVNPALHAAQLLWYITVQNRNPQSADFGKYVWFGLQLYDSRYGIPPFYADEDGGKDVNTGMFIYLPSADKYVASPVSVNNLTKVNYNVLPEISVAFALAQSRGYLTNTTFNDLYIGGMNIGWELPGTFDVCVEIADLNLYPIY